MWPPKVLQGMSCSALFHRWGTSPLWWTQRSLRTRGSDQAFCLPVCCFASVSNLVGMCYYWCLWKGYRDLNVFYSVWFTGMHVIVTLPTQGSTQNCESFLWPFPIPHMCSITALARLPHSVCLISHLCAVLLLLPLSNSYFVRSETNSTSYPTSPPTVQTLDSLSNIPRWPY